MNRSQKSFCFSTLLLGLFVAGNSAQEIHPGPQHFVFFGLDRDRIAEPRFLETESIVGAQLKYTWRELEPERDQYAFQQLRHDLAFLDQHGKRLFVQIQDVSFSDAVINVPEYLVDDPGFSGGAARQYEYQGEDESTAVPAGWVARRWDPAVRRRFVLLLRAIGRAFDGQITGINLAETAVSFGETGRLHPAGFSDEGYAAGVRSLMTAAREAFLRSEVILYANFMPGEWLPWNDQGYLRGVYEHADRIGIGVGGPDLLPHRRGQQNHSYPLIAARGVDTIAGVAVQSGNLEDRRADTGDRVTVRELIRFAEQDLHLDYLFWGTQEPYYSEDILPTLRAF